MVVSLYGSTGITRLLGAGGDRPVAARHIRLSPVGGNNKAPLRRPRSVTHVVSQTWILGACGCFNTLEIGRSFFRSRRKARQA